MRVTKTKTKTKAQTQTFQDQTDHSLVSSFSFLKPFLDVGDEPEMGEVKVKQKGSKKLPPTKKQYAQVVRWIMGSIASLDFDLTSVDLNLIKADEGRPYLICLAALFEFYDKVAVLAKAGADVNITDPILGGDNPLMFAIYRRAPVSALEILLKAGADPNLQHNSEITPWLRAMILDNKEAVACLAQNGATLPWKDAPQLSYFKDLYGRLTKQISEQYQKSKSEDKLFLAVVLEEHKHYESQITEAMVIDIMSSLGIKCYLEISPGTDHNDIATKIAKEHKLTIENIDIFFNLNSCIADRVKDITKREKGMVEQLLKPENGSGVLITGAGHAIICSDPALRKKFHIYAICSSKVHFENTKIFEWEKASFLELKKTQPIYFENPIVHSKKVVDLLRTAEKCLTGERSLRSLFVEKDIFPALPQPLAGSTVKRGKVAFLGDGSFGSNLKTGLSSAVKTSDDKLTDKTTKASSEKELAPMKTTASETKPVVKSDTVGFLSNKSSFAMNLKKGLKKQQASQTCTPAAGLGAGL